MTEDTKKGFGIDKIHDKVKQSKEGDFSWKKAKVLYDPRSENNDGNYGGWSAVSRGLPPERKRRQEDTFFRGILILPGRILKAAITAKKTLKVPISRLPT